MEVLTSSRLQDHMPAASRSTERKGRSTFQVAFVCDEPHEGDPSKNDFVKKARQSCLTPEGNSQSEYFGLAMAICAVGILRNASYFGSEAFANRFLKDVSQSKSQDRVSIPCNGPMPCSEDSGNDEKDAVDRNADQKVRRLQAEVSELKRLRSEAFKANERVVSIFSTKERDWKSERKRLREEQHKLYKELQRAFLKQNSLESQLQQLRGAQKQRTCMECQQRESLFVELKERLGEQEFLIMTTSEEAQIERLEKNTITEKLVATELCLSQMQEKLSVEAENYAVELAKRDELIKQLETKAKQVAFNVDRLQQELHASQAHNTAEKTSNDEATSVMSKKINEQEVSLCEKDFVIAALIKKAKADLEERTELTKEIAFMKLKLEHFEKEKQNWRPHSLLSSKSSFKEEVSGTKTSYETCSFSENMEDLQMLNDIEVENLRTVFEEEIQILQRRLSMSQERVADLEEDLLMSINKTKLIVRYDKDVSLTDTNIMDKKCLTALCECLEVELASKQFQLSVAKAYTKQFIDLEVYREQEVEKWKQLYFASKAAFDFHKDRKHTGAAIVATNSKLYSKSELNKYRFTYELEKRHWQQIDGFERQMRARDERMEAFRYQLLQMREEVQKAYCQVESLKQELTTAQSERRKVEEVLVQQAAHERQDLTTNKVWRDY